MGQCESLVATEVDASARNADKGIVDERLELMAERSKIRTRR